MTLLGIAETRELTPFEDVETWSRVLGPNDITYIVDFIDSLSFPL